MNATSIYLELQETNNLLRKLIEILSEEKQLRESKLPRSI